MFLLSLQGILPGGIAFENAIDITHTMHCVSPLYDPDDENKTTAFSCTCAVYAHSVECGHAFAIESLNELRNLDNDLANYYGPRHVGRLKATRPVGYQAHQLDPKQLPPRKSNSLIGTAIAHTFNSKPDRVYVGEVTGIMML